jgi:HlyD family secretion protein
MKKIIKFIVIGLLAIGVISTFVFLWKKSQPVVKQYEIVNVKTGNIEKKTVATGKVEPRNEILIKPQLSGIISEIYKEAGDKVSMGEVIAKIKLIPDMVSLNAAESRVVKAKLAFEQTTRNFERDKKLFSEKVISKDEFEKSQLQFNNDKAELKSAEDNLSLTRDGITNDKKMLTNTLVRSTINGTILDIPVKVGNSVTQSNNFNDGTTIASVANMNDMLFIGKLDETEVGKVKTGMPVEITIGAIQGTKLNAILEYIAPKGVENNGAIMFDMKAAVKVPSDVFIRAGYSANAEIIFDRAEKVITIPESCVEFKNDSAFVQILKVEKPQTFESRQVKTGLSDGINIEIKSGLKVKDKIRGAEIVEKKKDETAKPE